MPFPSAGAARAFRNLDNLTDPVYPIKSHYIPLNRNLPHYNPLFLTKIPDFPAFFQLASFLLINLSENRFLLYHSKILEVTV